MKPQGHTLVKPSTKVLCGLGLENLSLVTTQQPTFLLQTTAVMEASKTS